ESMTAAFVYSGGTVRNQAGIDLRDFLSNNSEPLDKLLALLAAKARTAPEPVRGIAVSLPCDLDVKRRQVLAFPQANWLDGKPLPELLEKTLNAPVLMERRGVIMLVCDQALLSLPEDCLAVACYIDTHYESAIWHKGAPMLGRGGGAGNIMHMTIHDREDSCFCGKSGCVDLYGAGTRLMQIQSMIFPDTPMEELFVRHSGHPIIRDYLSMMAYPIAIEADIIDPDFIIIGGAIPVIRDFPIKNLEEQILLHSYRPNPDSGPTFLASEASVAGSLACTAKYAMLKFQIEF
ncbi:MAG: ROK family protein, partial [Planctomycetes bacterium]|nr:ROK family protein [Planctomycetota bacterium]